jgi:hypothetical protein
MVVTGFFVSQGALLISVKKFKVNCLFLSSVAGYVTRVPREPQK